MTKFSQLLDERWGAAASLARYLDVPRSMVSNVKAGRKRMPPDWYAEVVEFFRGEITLSDLVPEKRYVRRVL